MTVIIIISKVVILTATGVNLLYTQQERVIMSSQYKITMIVQQTDEQEEFYGSPHKWSMDEWCPSDLASMCEVDVDNMDFDSDLSTDDDLIEEG